jgi:hypothetical protein
MRKSLLLIVLLFTSQFTHAVTRSEFDCVVKSTYHEARSLGKKDWLKVANTAYNRSVHFKEYNFGAKSKHLCDIVKSKQYSSSSKLNNKIKEWDRYNEIRKVLLTNDWKHRTKYLYFETKKGKMIYNVAWNK